MTPIQPGFLALASLATLIASGFIFLIVTKLFAYSEEKRFWKQYEERKVK